MHKKTFKQQKIMELIQLSGKTQNKHFMLTANIPKVSKKCKWNMSYQIFFVSSNKEVMILKKKL